MGAFDIQRDKGNLTTRRKFHTAHPSSRSRLFIPENRWSKRRSSETMHTRSPLGRRQWGLEELLFSLSVVGLQFDEMTAACSSQLVTSSDLAPKLTCNWQVPRCDWDYIGRSLQNTCLHRLYTTIRLGDGNAYGVVAAGTAKFTSPSKSSLDSPTGEVVVVDLHTWWNTKPGKTVANNGRGNWFKKTLKRILKARFLQKKIKNEFPNAIESQSFTGRCAKCSTVADLQINLKCELVNINKPTETR